MIECIDPIGQPGRIRYSVESCVVQAINLARAPVDIVCDQLVGKADPLDGRRISAIAAGDLIDNGKLKS